MSRRLIVPQIDRKSAEDLLARGLAVSGGGNVLIAKSAEAYEQAKKLAVGYEPPFIPLNAEVRGTLYAVRALPSTPVKLGFTRAERIEYRMLGLQTGNPFPLTVAATASCWAAQEREVHELLAADRLTGEWFEWTARVQAFVAALAGGIEAAIASCSRTEEG